MSEQHLDLDGLADLLATGTADHDPVDAHLGSCAQCRSDLGALRAALEPVAASLAALPLPAAPADLDARLTTALQGLRTKQEGQQVTRLADRRAPGRLAWLPIAGGLAAAAALVFAVVIVNGGGDQPSTGGTAQGTSALGTRTSNTGLAYGADGGLLAGELPSLLNGTATGLPTAGTEALASDQASRSSTKSSGPLLGTPDAAAADPLSRLRTTTGLASCLASLTEGADASLPLALDYASFNKKPAMVVVLASEKADKVDVFVVGAGCAQADANLLYFARLPAPS